MGASLAIEEEINGPKSVLIAQGMWKDDDCTFGTKNKLQDFFSS